MSAVRTLSHHDRRALGPRRAGALGRRPTGEPGYVLVTTALLLVPMMIVSALAVDVGTWYSRAMALQRAADAGALAGVVYLPEGLEVATSVAIETIRKNGVDTADPNITVTVTRVPNFPRRLRVELADARVPTFFGSLVRDSVSIRREAVGEYIRPVPLGSPNNFLGTRDLALTTGPGLVNGTHGGSPASMYTRSVVNGQVTQGEQFWLAVDSYCRGRMRGDLFVPFVNNQNLLGGGDRWNADGVTRNGTANHKDCPSNAASNRNEYYGGAGASQKGMELAVMVEDPPPGAPLHIEVFDAGFSRGNDNETTRFGCGVTTNSNHVTGTGPGSSLFDQNWTFQACPPAQFAQAPLNAIDTTFTFYEVDGNILDGVPNPVIESQVSVPAAPRNATNAYRQRWARMHTVTSPQAGEYRFTVDLEEDPSAYGVNGFAVRAYYGSTFTPCTTDAASTRPVFDPAVSCPQVYATNWLNMFLGGTIDPKPYLASIGPEYGGKIAQVTTFDPDFSANYIGLLDPNGDPVRFDYTTSAGGATGGVGNRCGTSGSDVTQISINYGTPFDNCLITMSFEIPANSEELFGDRTWWRIDYDSGGATRTADRSTWGVVILGDPVRLVIEQ